MKILVLGATGLLGHVVYRRFAISSDFEVLGTIRNEAARRLFPADSKGRLLEVGDLSSLESLEALLERAKPEVIINCLAVGRPSQADPMHTIMLHSVLPRRLAHLGSDCAARIIQISSDGVFSGSKGAYTEDDIPDATDLYGVSKILGELREAHTVTVRSSIIGHELQRRGALLEWFMSQKEECHGYDRAIFSGFPTVVLADIIRDVIIPHQTLHGIYHVASRPISKFDLLKLIAHRYNKSIRLVPDHSVSVDRSLVADRFQNATGYAAPDWPKLVDVMYRDQMTLVAS